MEKNLQQLLGRTTQYLVFHCSAIAKKYLLIAIKHFSKSNFLTNRYNYLLPFAGVSSEGEAAFYVLTLLFSSKIARAERRHFFFFK